MIWVILYLGSILLANWLVIEFGIVKWGFLSFPAGAVCIGLTFSFRDFVQRKYGKWGAWVWMLVATLVTVLFNRRIAFASGAAFFISEGLDWLVYTITKRSFRERLIFSNLVGIPVDSLVFVVLAFGWVWPAIWGQTLVKLASGFLILPFIWRRDEVLFRS